jgi:Fur family peroxide stress response transcriptional regulator
MLTLEKNVVEEAIDGLKDAKIRITPQRYAVLEYLIKNMNHPCADDIYQALSDKFPSMSVATVYNNLRLFTEIGLVNEMKFGDASSRFDFNSTPHYHAICNKCGKIEDFVYPKLEEIETTASILTGFKVEEHRAEVYGTCGTCS